jgi:CHAT domain-containing protein/Tfp pilus assembly protein PilF
MWSTIAKYFANWNGFYIHSLLPSGCPRFSGVDRRLKIHLKGGFAVYSKILFRLCLPVVIFSLLHLCISPSCAGAFSSISVQSSDEAALRAVVETFYAAYTKEDLESFTSLWSSKSPDLTARRKAMEKLFADNDKIEVKSLTTRKATVEGERAKIRAEIDFSAIDIKTGKTASGFGKTNRSFSFVKEEGKWKIWQERSAAEEVVNLLVSLKTEEARTQLLAEEKDLMTVEFIRALLQRGNLLRRQGDYPQSIVLYETAQSIAEQLGDKFQTAGAIHMSGIAKYLMGDAEMALARFRKSIQLFEFIQDKKNIAMVLNSFGNVYNDQGNYRLAFESLERAKKLNEEIGDKLGLSQALTNIATSHYLQGNFDLATEIYEKSLELETQLGNKYNMAGSFHNLGMVQAAKGNYSGALTYYQRTLAIGEELKAQPGIALTLTSIGSLYRRQNQFKEALEYYEKSKTIYEVIGDQRGLIDSLTGIADIQYKLGSYTEAIKTAERAVTLANGNYMEFLRQLYITQGTAYRALGQTDKARQLFDQSIAMIETLRAQLGGGEQERQNFLERRISPYHEMVDLLISQDKSGEALVYAELSKARVLLDTLQSGRINVTKAMSAQEQEQERKLKDEIIFLNSQLVREKQNPQANPSRLPDLSGRIVKARLQYEEFQSKLYAVHPELKMRRGQTRLLKPEEAAELLPDGKSALLEFLVTDEKTFLFVITKKPDSAGTTIDLRTYTIAIKHSDLITRVEEFRQQLATRDLRFGKQSRALYELLVKPAQAQLQGKTNIVIVPDNILWELPFQALQSAAEHYFIENAALFYAPSLSVLREMMKTRKPKSALPSSHKTLLAFGNPDLKNETVARIKALNRDEKLGPLPEAEKEVKALAELYGAAQSKIYIGAEAREERVKAEANQFSILHFATHGIFNNISPMYSHLVMSQAEGNEDGLLEAWEIMKLDLQADMIVLSACETARGQVRAGEGVVGLTWAIFVAGSPTTVVSQWKVDSASTAELMLDFYRTLKASATKSEALRTAALRMLKRGQYRHPFYWAGFVLVGDGFSGKR